jgi:drug/metabolite transporter (DMT)-like permease
LDHGAPKASHQWAGLLAAAVTLGGWSLTPVFVGSLTEHIDAWTSNGWRYGLAALTWMPLLAAARWRGRWPVGLMRRALVPAAINAVAQSCFTYGFYLIDPTLVIIALRLQIVAVAIGAAVMFPAERRIIRTPMFVLGAALATAGIMGVLVLKLEQGGVGQSRNIVLGVLLGVAAGVGFGGYALAVRKFMRGVPSPLAFAAIGQYSALAMVVVMLAASPTHGGEVPRLPAGPMLILVVSTYTGIAGTHVFYYIAIQRLGVAATTAVLQLQPFGVGLISYFVLGDVLTLPQWACGVIATGGAGLAIWVQHRLRERPAGASGERGGEGFETLPVDEVVASVLDERERV